MVTKWFEIAVFICIIVFQKSFSEWKPYIANIACKSLNKEKLLLEVVVQGNLMPCPSMGPK